MSDPGYDQRLADALAADKKAPKWYHQTWFIILASIFFFPVGLILAWLAPGKRWDLRIAATVWSLLILILGISGGGKDSSAPSSVASSTPPVVSSSSSNAPTTPSAPATPPPKPAPKEEPKWNTTDMNIETNGNFQVAKKVLATFLSPEGLKAIAGTQSAAAVAKAPWKYVGTPVALTGRVAIAQAYPPGSNVAKILSDSEPLTELVMISSDTSTPIDYMMVGETGANQGDVVTVYGYVVGNEEVENKMGGKTTQVLIAGMAASK